MVTWHCVKQCGACCQLDPADRPDLDQYLTPEELEHYLSLVGADGWCIHYDGERRECRIYEERPSFCRVTPNTFHDMFGVDPQDFQDFAIACCQQQIEGVYGRSSQEMTRFDAAMGLGDREEGDESLT